MSRSEYVCWRDGLPITYTRYGWRHALGRMTGAIPKYRKHKPVPAPRADYERFINPATPLDEARNIAAKYEGK